MIWPKLSPELELEHLLKDDNYDIMFAWWPKKLVDGTWAWLTYLEFVDDSITEFYNKVNSGKYANLKYVKHIKYRRI